jgi:hypothetical protein
MMMDTVNTQISNIPSISELGLNDQNIVQVNCQRSISGDSFVQGTQDFLFSVAGNQRFSPMRSFFRARAALQVSDDTGATWRQPVMADNVALSESFMNNCYSNAYFYASSVDISSLTQFTGQASMVHHRLTKTKPWLDSIGGSYWLNANFQARQALTARDGTSGVLKKSSPSFSLQQLGFADTAEIAVTAGVVPPIGQLSAPVTVNITADVATKLKANVIPVGALIEIKAGTVISKYIIETIDETNPLDFEYTARPYGYTLAVGATIPEVTEDVLTDNATTVTQYFTPEDNGYNSVEMLFVPPCGIFNTDSALPAGAYRISLMPKNDLTSAIEYQGPLPLATSKKFRVVVNSLFFFMSVFRSEHSFDNNKYYLELEEYNIQTKPLSSGLGQNSLNFTLPATTIGIAAFVQNTAAGTVAQLPPSVFKSLMYNGTTPMYVSSQSNDLSTVQLTYSNTSKPTQNYTSVLETKTATGEDSLQWIQQRYIDTQINSDLFSLSAESFSDWLTRGNIYYFSWVRSASDKSTELQITMSFNAGASGAGLEANNQLFICSVYRKVIQITVANGYIADCLSLAI